MTNPLRRRRPRTSTPAASQRVRALPVLASVIALALLVPAAGTSGAARDAAPTTYPVGRFDVHEPSYFAPPAPDAMPGYRELYVNDFTTPLLYSYWFVFHGMPKGDVAGYFERSHVSVHKGELRLGTWRDPARRNLWTSGGVCLCGVHPKYGAFFVRSRESSYGPDDAEMLWSLVNQPLPEVDFAETGAMKWFASWFDHYAPAPDTIQHHTHIDILNWHTWGIVWTPTSMTFVVDGKPWGQVTVPAEIPQRRMTLNLTQETWCGIFPECPRSPSSLLVDWVAIYVPT